MPVLTVDQRPSAVSLDDFARTPAVQITTTPEGRSEPAPLEKLQATATRRIRHASHVQKNAQKTIAGGIVSRTARWRSWSRIATPPMIQGDQRSPKKWIAK